MVNWAFDHGVSAHGAPCDRVPVTVAASEVRRAVRDALAALPDAARRVPLVVGCSGGADSLALTIAAAAVRGVDDVQAVVVDHRLQEGSAERAAATVALLAERGIAARVQAVDVTGPGGIEAAARRARQAALCAARPHPDSPILLGHTLDDQAETVLLGLGRGSGARSLAGMRRWDPPFLRPLLTVRRATTRAACTGFAVWDDPHNADPRFTRVRLRHEVLPLLEDVLSGGVAEALARTADQLREDEQAFSTQIDELIEELCAPAEAGIAVSTRALAANPAALRQRIIRHVVASEFGVSLSRTQTLEVARLVTDWHGQGPIDLPGGIRATRAGTNVVFSTTGSTEVLPHDH